jgi:H+/Cl- antiporter ClcA
MVLYHPFITYFLVGGVALISLALATLAYRAMQRTGNRKLGFVTAAFLVFALKSVVTTFALLADPSQGAIVSTSFPLTHGHLEFLNSALDLVIVFLLVVPFLRRT